MRFTFRTHPAIHSPDMVCCNISVDESEASSSCGLIILTLDEWRKFKQILKCNATKTAIRVEEEGV